jgi:hypothetical protein
MIAKTSNGAMKATEKTSAQNLKQTLGICVNCAKMPNCIWSRTAVLPARRCCEFSVRENADYELKLKFMRG